jgi:hypothetical protein
MPQSFTDFLDALVTFGIQYPKADDMQHHDQEEMNPARASFQTRQK